MSNETNIEELERIAKDLIHSAPWTALYKDLTIVFEVTMTPENVLSLIDRLKKAEAELENERMRLTACGVVALADTPESAAKAREMRDEYRSASCDDVARRVDECMTLRAERDALAAKLAELEGQEPAAWANADELDNILEDRLVMVRGTKDGYRRTPLYARPVPAEHVNARLFDVATGKIQHRYLGHCPDSINGSDSRDPGCPACQAIAAAEAQQERLLQDMHDAGREIDRVMAEAAPKAVRLTMGECMQAVKHISFEEMTLFGIARAIETAVLRKNGIEVAE